MELSALILIFATFTVPAIVSVFVFIDFYKKKKLIYDIFYILLYYLTAVLIISLVKLMLVIEMSFSPMSFLIGNTLFFFTFGVFAVAVSRVLKLRETLRVSNRELVLILVIGLASIFLKDAVNALDFFVYSATFVVAYAISRTLYAYSQRKSPFLFAAYKIPAAILMADSIAKYVFYCEKLPLFPTLHIFLSLRLLGLLTLVFLAHLTGRTLNANEIPQEVFLARRRSIKRALAVTFLINIAIITLASNLFVGIRKYRIEKFDRANTDLSIYAYTTGTSLSRLLNYEFLSHIEYLSREREIIEPGKREIEVENFYESHKDTFCSVILMNPKGIIEFAVPFKASIGSDISYQKHVQKVLETKQPVLSDPFMDLLGFPAIGFHIPLFDANNVFRGTVAGLIDLRQIPSLIRTLPEKGKEFLIFKNGLLLASSTKDYEVLSTSDQILTDAFLDENFTGLFKFRLYGEELEVITFSNKNYFVKDVGAYALSAIFQSLPSLLILLIVLTVFLLTLSRQDIELGKKVEDAILREREERFSRERFQDRLSRINEFIYGISPEQTAREVAETLLKLMLTVIEVGDRGSVFIRVGDFLEPLATVGYRVESLGKVRIPLELEKKRWGTGDPIIVRDILDKTPSEVPKDNFSEAKSFDIKETIVVPIASINDYFGTIYVDSVRGYDVFSEDDLKIAKATAKIARFYFENIKLVDELSLEANENLRTTEKLQRLLNATASFTFLESKEEFFDELLGLSMEIVEGAERGTVLLKEGQNLTYIACRNYPFEKLRQIRIPLEAELRVTERGKAQVIKRISEVEKLSAEQEKFFREIDAFSIKYTITAPVYVGEEYFGGIFIDSTKEEPVFTEGDKKVMVAVSNLASLYMRTRLLIEEVEKNAKLSIISAEIFKACETVKDRAALIQTIYREINRKLEVKVNEVLIASLVDEEVTIYCATESKARVRNYESMPSILASINESTVISKHLGEFSKFLIDKDRLKSILIVPQGKSATTMFSFKEEVPPDLLDLLKAIGKEIRDFVDSKELSFKVVESYLETLVLTVKAIDSRDPYTKEHSENVTKYAYLIGKRVGLPYLDLRSLVLSALLHDVGKIGIPDSILKKEDALTKEEYEVIKNHTVIGWQMLKDTKLLKKESEYVLRHHEWFNGNGYPSGIKGFDIPIYSRIISVADAFDAMTTQRPYRSAKTVEEAKKELKQFGGIQFDPEIVGEFLAIVEVQDINKLDLLSILQEVFKQ